MTQGQDSRCEERPGAPCDLTPFIEDIWARSIMPVLRDYIRIPNVSPAFDPDWAQQGYMDDAVTLLDSWSETVPLAAATRRIVRLPGRTPLLLMQIPASPGCEATPTTLLYGHYDKQPAFTGWLPGLGPWEPVERDGRLYGRGGADDGYALFASLTAIAALQQSGLPHGRCVLLIEGCEESGSFDLPHYVAALKEEIGEPGLVICLDAECGNYDQLWVTTSLRGMLPGVLRVEILSEGQHSGAAGGIVPSSFRILRGLIERIEDAATGALHDVLRAEAPAWARTELERAGAVLGEQLSSRFPWVPGAGPQDLSPTQLLLANTWEPSLAVVGLDGAPAIGDAGNTLRPGTAAKLVLRLPPSLPAEAAAESVKALLEADPPYGARVSFDLETPQTGWCAPETAPWLKAALASASEQYFGRPPMYMGMGGTIPFMKMLADAYPGVQFLVTGVLGPGSNAHGPNEYLDLATARRLTGCVASVLFDACQNAQAEHGRTRNRGP